MIQPHEINADIEQALYEYMQHPATPYPNPDHLPTSEYNRNLYQAAKHAEALNLISQEDGIYIITPEFENLLDGES